MYQIIVSIASGDFINELFFKHEDALEFYCVNRDEETSYESVRVFLSTTDITSEFEADYQDINPYIFDANHASAIDAKKSV